MSSELRGDPEINSAIDKCNQALARVNENMVRRANLIHYLNTVQGISLRQHDKDFFTKRLNDANSL